MQPIVEPGTIEVMIGAASDDIRLKSSFVVEGDTVVVDPPWGVLETSVSIK